MFDPYCDYCGRRYPDGWLSCLHGAPEPAPEPPEQEQECTTR